jgi:hypothetical protein
MLALAQFNLVSLAVGLVVWIAPPRWFLAHRPPEEPPQS